MTNTNKLPWEIKKVSRSGRGGIHVIGTCHYDGSLISWSISEHSFKDPEFASRRYDFRNADFEDESSIKWLTRVWPQWSNVSAGR